MDKNRRDSLRAWAERMGNPWSGNDQAADAVLELLDAYEVASTKAEALDDIIEAVVSDGYGDCLWCGGKLDTASCGREGHDGCMGYTNEGKHEEDCIFLPFITTK